MMWWWGKLKLLMINYKFIIINMHQGITELKNILNKKVPEDYNSLRDIDNDIKKSEFIIKQLISEHISNWKILDLEEFLYYFDQNDNKFLKHEFTENSRWIRKKSLNNLIQVFLITITENTNLDMKPKPYLDWEYIHPKITTHSRKLFEDGHFGDTCHKISLLIEVIIRNLIKNKNGENLTGKPMMQKAFNPNTGLFKFNEYLTQTEKDTQEGLSLIFTGFSLAVRNVFAHEIEAVSQKDAIHIIYLGSYLMYKLDPLIWENLSDEEVESMIDGYISDMHDKWR